MSGAGDHAEIVNGQPGILHMEDRGDQLAHPVHRRIIGHHGVVVDHQMDIVRAVALALQIVDDLVALQGVLVLIHLHMETGEALAGAVIVDHQVMEAQDLGLGADEFSDGLPELRIRRFAQQGGNGLPGQAPAAPQDEQGHGQTHAAVDLPGGEMLCQACQQHGAGGDAVVAAVGGGGLQGGGADERTQLAVEPGQPQLHGDGRDQHTGGHGAEFHGGGIQDLLHRGLGQLEADDDDHSGHGQARQVFKPGVSIGMLGVGRLLRQPEAHQSYDGRGSVGKVVHGVGGDGNGSRQGANRQLSGEEQQVADNAHQAGQPPQAGTGVFAFGILAGLHRQTKQQVCHRISS